MCNETSTLNVKIQTFSQESHTIDYNLYDGIKLSFVSLTGNTHTHSHKSLKNILEINYCWKGRIGWEMRNRNRMYLGEHDFSIHSLECCSTSTITLPNEYYEGITIYVDLDILSQNPPDLLQGSGITGDTLYKKFCKNDYFTTLIGNEETDSIFSAFYHQPKELQPAYWRIKVIELLLYLSKLSINTENRLSEYQSEQVEIIRNIHKYLLDHLNQRISIEEIACKYLINPTSLKSIFKGVYGTSIAAHMKEHRMKFAARLLIETSKTIKEIAKDVGYESQSKFSKVFKDYYNVLPTEYRTHYLNK